MSVLRASERGLTGARTHNERERALASLCSHRACAQRHERAPPTPPYPMLNEEKGHRYESLLLLLLRMAASEIRGAEDPPLRFYGPSLIVLERRSCVFERTVDSSSWKMHFTSWSSSPPFSDLQRRAVEGSENGEGKTSVMAAGRKEGRGRRWLLRFLRRKRGS